MTLAEEADLTSGLTGFGLRIGGPGFEAYRTDWVFCMGGFCFDLVELDKGLGGWRRHIFTLYIGD